MIKKATKLILLVSLFSISFVVHAQQNNIIDQVIWVVGDEAILKSDVEEARIAMIAHGERIEGDPYCIIPEKLAERKLYLDQAKADSIDISTSDLSREVASMEKRAIANAGGSRQKLEEYTDMSIHQLREMWSEQSRTMYLTEKVQEKLTKNVTLTPSEVRKYYNQLPKDSLPYIPISVEVQILTNEPQIPLKEIDLVKGRLRDFTTRINAGETSFAALAILYSEDGAAANGGEMGFMGRGSLDASFASVAFSLNDPKKVSNIVETEFGYHIIQLVERRGDRGNFRHIILRPKVPAEEMTKSFERLQEMRDSITNGVFKFEEAVTHFSYDKETRKSEGLMVNLKQGYDGRAVATSRFIMEDLPPEVAKAVDTLQVNSISKPFLMKDKKTGKDIIAIAKLKSRIAGHVANVSDDYEDLRGLVEEQKKEELLKKWLLRKIRDTYVFIDEEWRGCDFQNEGWMKENKTIK